MPRLKLKTKLVLAITGMVFALVLALSCIYVSQLIDQRLTEADSNASFVAHQVLDAARKALETDPGPARPTAPIRRSCTRRSPRFCNRMRG